MSYEVALFVPPKREDYDNSRVEFDAESQQIFRMSRVLSPQGKAVMEHLARTVAENATVPPNNKVRDAAPENSRSQGE